jgi:hypothetical protein
VDIVRPERVKRQNLLHKTWCFYACAAVLPLSIQGMDEYQAVSQLPGLHPDSMLRSLSCVIINGI